MSTVHKNYIVVLFGRTSEILNSNNNTKTPLKFHFIGFKEKIHFCYR